MDAVFGHIDVFWAGLRQTLALTFLSGILALALGLVIAVLRISPVPVCRALGTAYVEVIRNTPSTILFFFVAFVLPQLGVRLPYFLFAVIALTVYYASFFCEAIRSGVNSVAPGQVEAARSIGLTFSE